MADDVSREASRWPGGSLRATGVSRAFEGVHALRSVDIEVDRHEVVGLIGPNGAGKTTLVNVITGFDFPTSGSVTLADEPITSWSAHRRGRAGLARTFQHSRSFASLSVRENVEVAALGSGAGTREAPARGPVDYWTTERWTPRLLGLAANSLNRCRAGRIASSP